MTRNASGKVIYLYPIYSVNAALISLQVIKNLKYIQIGVYMLKDKNLIAILLAILAAALYAISTPVSKVML